MSITTFILSVIVVLVIGAVANKVSHLHMPGSWVGILVAGYTGTWVGPYLFGTWGPILVGYALVPSLIGAILVVVVVGLLWKIFD
ncbi:GlsB/YeaQ/YmgE family stress response membrane protein [Peribacillus acanthi]|uniref:GlsB/YeaQ/YmgE family stress response membrane protein n=1 Tax=Peribacillus acanthi TaxID=2171554 RepID=UPI000D3EE20D|nr:GlsB/YeaQ/YmgE family stress response membrane protein [Peribacillus acanthi]